MLSPDFEQRRAKANDLLTKCADEKLLRGGVPAAVKLARDAYELTKADPALAPLHQISAYRLAHLMLRLPDCDNSLAEIQRLFERAAGERPGGEATALGPLPDLFCLAVLHRRLQLAKDALIIDALKREMDQRFDQASKGVKGVPSARSSSCGTIQQDGGRGQLQASLFNLLELAAYFLGMDYSKLEGLGVLGDLEPSQSDAWLLVGPMPEISNVRHSELLAMQELTTMGRVCPDALLIRRPPAGHQSEWRMGGQSDSEWREVNDTWVHLLAWVLKEPTVTRQMLRARIMGGHDEVIQNNFRKDLERMRKNLSRLTGQPDLQVFVSGSDPLRLTDEVTVFGAVHVDTFRRRP